MENWSVAAALVFAVLLLKLLTVLGRGLAQYAGYLLLLLGALLLSGWVLVTDRVALESGGPSVELLLSAAACGLLVVVPALLERATRRAFVADRLARAARLAGIKELLVPGRASAAERELYEQMAEARGGRVDGVLRKLREQLALAEPPDDEAIQERMVTLLVFARRFSEAVAHFERHLGDDPVRYPGLAIQMVMALGEMGELAKAAELVRRLEETLNPQDATGRAVLLQVRLHLLSAAGAERAVERILALDELKRMPARMRESFVAVARRRARSQTIATTMPGAVLVAESPGADASLEGAAAAGGTPAAVAGSEPAFDLSEELARFLEAVAERAAIDLRVVPAVTRAVPPATFAILVASGIAYVALRVLVGDPVEPDHLVREGAGLHLAIRGGEWYRAFSSLFVYANLLHLFVVLYGLYLLGRIVEPVVGALRFVLIFFIAGLAANVASTFGPGPDPSSSLGASGAVLGMMAALMSTLLLRRDALPESWRRGPLGNFGLLLAVQLAVGYTWLVRDHVGHAGGLVGGAAAALLFGPGGLVGNGRVGKALTALGLLLLGAVAGYSVWRVVRESPPVTLAQIPRARVEQGGVSVSLPVGANHVPSLLLDEDALAVHYAELTLIPSLVTNARGVEGALGEAAARDLLHAAAKHPEGITIEDAATLSVPGWTSFAKRQPHEVVNVFQLYYARLVSGSDPARVVLVRFIHAGPRTLVFDTEVRRILDSVEVPAGPTASGARP